MSPDAAEDRIFAGQSLDEFTRKRLTSTQPEAVFSAMLQGWSNLMKSGQHVRDPDVYLRTVTVFQREVGGWPWEWTPTCFTNWSAAQSVSPSTLRQYQGRIRKFVGYVMDSEHEWPSICRSLYNAAPQQISFDEGTVKRVLDDDSNPERRPLSDAELQRLFDAAADLANAARTSGRKGALPAYRNLIILYVAYGWGLRANECARLDLADFSRNPQAPEFAEFGVVHVRFGKGRRGAAKKRIVLSVHDWATEVVQGYISQVRDLFPCSGETGALFLTERGTQISPDIVSTAFRQAARHAGLSKHLTLHCLRHTYASNLAAAGWDHRFIQEQLGHEHPSTTSIYTKLPTDYRVRSLRTYLDHRTEGL